METSENLSRTSKSRSIASGFPVGRCSSVLKWKDKRSMQAKEQRVKQLISPMPWHAVFAFLNPLLIGVLQVKFQGAKVSPFDTNASHFHTFLLATLIYCFAFAINIKCHHGRTNYTWLSSHMALISGSLSSVSLVSIFLPRLLGQLILLSWIILPIVLLRQLTFRIFRWTYQWISKAIFRLYLKVVNRFNMKYGNNEQQQLPL